MRFIKRLGKDHDAEVKQWKTAVEVIDTCSIESGSSEAEDDSETDELWETDDDSEANMQFSSTG